MGRSGRKNKRASFQNCCATLEPRRHATDGITHHAEACRADTWAAGASSMRLELVLMVCRLWEVTRSTHHFSRGANTRRRATNGHGNESRAVTASRTAPPFVCSSLRAVQPPSHRVTKAWASGKSAAGRTDRTAAATRRGRAKAVDVDGWIQGPVPWWIAGLQCHHGRWHGATRLMMMAQSTCCK